ncbi:MAG: LarC family nickel insertion protein, partial [Cyanobacteria bacterium]|nr:LarC family nickel insertion protein [Cyanobacteria bacterium CG_2015-16_32_12]
PQMSLIKIGRGAGSQDLEIPNILQLWIGESKQSDNLEEIAVLETQIDDTNPQVFGYLLEELLKIGAKDVFTQPVGMKKNRQGILLTVICDVDKIDICETIIFRETTTIGIRRQIQQRSILAREIVTVKTKYGDIRVKVAKKDDEIVNIQPEYEDCAMIARKSNIPLNLIALEAQKNAQH